MEAELISEDPEVDTLAVEIVAGHKAAPKMSVPILDENAKDFVLFGFYKLSLDTL